MKHLKLFEDSNVKKIFGKSKIESDSSSIMNHIISGLESNQLSILSPAVSNDDIYITDKNEIETYFIFDGEEYGYCIVGKDEEGNDIESLDDVFLSQDDVDKLKTFL